MDDLSGPQGFNTTVDVIRKQKYNVTTTAGMKRRLVDEPVYSSTIDKIPSPLLEISSNSHHGFKRPRVEASAASDGLRASKIDTFDSLLPKEPTIYTQRKLAASTPGVSQNPQLSLSHPCYDLPEALVQNFASLGISSIYPWQSTCLLGRDLLTGEKNLVYSAPTGGGKSLVADVLMLKRVLENKKAILVLPYVALVQEKLKWLRRAVAGVEKGIETSNQPTSRYQNQNDHRSIRVVGFFGGSKARETWADVDIAVCTIEKANSLVNTAIEDGSSHELGVIVLDELHMINDDHRGYLMELTVTKLLSLEQNTQIIGMSATLSNTSVLAEWLDARCYQTNYKPIPIEEYLVYDNKVYPVSTSRTFLRMASQLKEGQSETQIPPYRRVQSSRYKQLVNPVTNAVVALAVETNTMGYSALVFCASRAACQSTASLISEAMPPLGELDAGILNQREDVLYSLRSLAVGLDEVLEKTIPRGVAFHHAGLTTEERDVIAEAYDRKVLKVIVATCSLAAGINLPARRVILQGARMGRDLVGPALLRQMRGRAGRKGKDEIGESYVCCQKDDLEEVGQLLEADTPATRSCLTPEKRGISRALLEVVVVRLASHPGAIEEYIRRTLLYHSMDHHDLDVMVQTTIAELMTSKLVTLGLDGSFTATLLGQAVVAASLTPEDGLFVHSDFERALRAFVMDNEMHVFYLFTPVQSIGLSDINWPVFRREVERLEESGLRVLNFCGISPAFVNRMANSARQLPQASQNEKEVARVHHRFYVALQLRDLCNEIPIHVVAKKYEVQRGLVQNLVQTCEGFAAGMIKFCAQMQWGMLQSVLEHMRDRLKAGAKSDLLELAQIPFVKSRTARVFWENGLRSVRGVAEAEPRDLVPILLLAQPKKSKINGDDESKYHQKLTLKAEIIVSAANRLWERQQRVDVEVDI